MLFSICYLNREIISGLNLMNTDSDSKLKIFYVSLIYNLDNSRHIDVLSRQFTRTLTFTGSLLTTLLRQRMLSRSSHGSDPRNSQLKDDPYHLSEAVYKTLSNDKSDETSGHAAVILYGMLLLPPWLIIPNHLLCPGSPRWMVTLLLSAVIIHCTGHNFNSIYLF